MGAEEEEMETVIKRFQKSGLWKAERELRLQAVALFLFLRMANTKLDFSADGKRSSR